MIASLNQDWQAGSRAYCRGADCLRVQLHQWGVNVFRLWGQVAQCTSLTTESGLSQFILYLIRTADGQVLKNYDAGAQCAT